MEAAIVNILSGLVANGAITVTGLVLIIILILGLLSFYLFRPMYKSIKDIPSKAEIEELIKLKKEFDSAQIDEINEKLKQILDVIDKIDHTDEHSYREVKEIRRDIETVKQILNQFQGHMMYSKSNDFGNRELK